MSLFQSETWANCSSQLIQFPTLPGAQIQSLGASLVRKGWQYIPAGVYSNNGAVTTSGVSFCNVTIVYTPLNRTKPTTVQIWLPTKWNGRIQGVGGAGWVGGLTDFQFMTMTAAVAQGYTTMTTNGGFPTENPRDWAFSSPGVIDREGLEHWASTSLNDLAILSKAVSQTIYGQPASYSYWNGCSTGGRQGFQLAQKYPNAFNGITASAAPVRFDSLIIAGFWSQTSMHELGIYINPCELNALTEAAIKSCDHLDGVVDGLISAPELCYFDPFTLVNSSVPCTGLGYGAVLISEAAASLAQIGWYGMNASRHSFMHDRNNHEAPFVTTGIPGIGPFLPYLNFTMGLADRECGWDGKCTGKPYRMVDDWIRIYVMKDPNYDTSKISIQDYDAIFEKSVKEYAGIIGTDSTNLKEFRDAGGKILSYHGLADPVIPAKNSRRYYESVMAEDSSVRDYYRHFEAPGVGHCYSGSGLYPADTFESLIKWVEKGEAPEKLTVDTSSLIGPRKSRILCPYPQRSQYKGTGDTSSADSYHCGKFTHY